MKKDGAMIEPQPPKVCGPSQRRATLGIFAAAVGARGIVLWDTVRNHPHEWLYSRGIEMGMLANSLLHGNGYSSPFGGLTGPTAFIAPGYPTLVAAIFLVFGTYSYLSAVAIITLQILIGVLTVWTMMYVGRELFNEATARLSGAIWALSLPVIFIPTIFWETSISACAPIGLIALLLRHRRTPTTSSLIAIGTACAVVSLANPALLPCLAALLLWAAYGMTQAIRPGIGVSLVAFFLLFAAWPIRNAYRFHAFIPLRSTVGFELWMGNRPGATGYLDETLFPMYNRAELASYLTKGEVAYTRGKSEQAMAYIHAYPLVFIRMTATRFFRFWTGTGNASGSAVYAVHATLTSILGLLGLCILLRRKTYGLALLLGIPLALFPLPYYITHAEFRYRLVIDPILTILSAFAVTELIQRESSRKMEQALTLDDHVQAGRQDRLDIPQTILEYD